MPIDIRLLRQACALSEHGSFRRAAESLRIAQPSLSRGIKDLETLVGLPLFVRSRTGHEPTDFGRVFLQHAVAVLESAGELDREIARAKGMETGEVALGVGPYPAEALAPGSAARFAAARPGVRLRILTGDPSTVFRSLRSRAIDLAVAEHSVLADDHDLEIVARLAPFPGHAIVRAGHPLARARRVELADLLDHPYAQVAMLPPRVLKPVLAARRAPAAGDAGSPPPFPAFDCATVRLALGIVAASDAFTFASLGMVRDELERGRLVPVLRAPWLHGGWHLVRSQQRPVSPAVLDLAREIERAHADALREEAALEATWLRPAPELPPGRPEERRRRGPDRRDPGSRPA